MCVQTLSLVFLNYSIKFIIHMRVTCVYVWFIRVHPYVHMQHGHKIIVHLRIFICLSFFFLSFLNSILIFFYSFIFFFFFFRLIISTRFDFVNVGRNPSCEIWRKNPNSRACARRDAHYNFEKCFSKYVSREINDRSSLRRSNLSIRFFFQVYLERVTRWHFSLNIYVYFFFCSPYVYTCARSRTKVSVRIILVREVRNDAVER